MGDVRIIGISGSSRKGSFNAALLSAAAELLPEGASLEALGVSGFPPFSQDMEESPPPEVARFREKVKTADAVLFSTPEFNFSIPAQLKNAIEWASRPEVDNAWDGKAAAIMSASTGPRGGARAQLHLRQIMVDLNMHPLNAPQLYVSRAQEAFDADLRLTDERHRKTLASLLRALVDWAARLKVTG